MRTLANPMDTAARDTRFGSRDAVFFAGVFVFAWLHLFKLPATPYYFDGDTLVPVSNAVRMLNGEKIFKDFFHFVAPGADLLYASLFTVFGRSIWVINAAILFLTLAQVWLLWFFGRRTLSGAAAYLPALIFLVLGFRQFGIDGSQRLMSVVLAFAAIAAIAFSRNLSNLALAGVLCAGASFFQQQRGAVVGAAIGAFLIWEWYVDGRNTRKLLAQSAVLASSFLILTALAHAYFLISVGFADYYYSMVGFISNSYGADRFNNSSAYLSDLRSFAANAAEAGSPVSSYARLTVISSFYYLLVPYVYMVFAAYAWLRRSSLRLTGEFRLLVLLCLSGAFSTIGVSAPTITRLFHVAIPAIVIFVWLCSRSGKFGRMAPSLAALMIVLCLLLAIQRQAAASFSLDMPAGRSYFLYGPTFEKYRWIGEHTRPGDVIYEPHHPNFYFPFALRNPTPLNTVRDSGYTPPAQIAAVMRGLENQPPRLVVWPGSWSKNPEERLSDDGVGPIWSFLKEHYQPIHTFAPPDDPARVALSANVVYKLVEEARP